MSGYLKMILFGDSLSGKTELIYRYTKDEYKDKYISMDYKTCSFYFSGETRTVTLMETSEQKKNISVSSFIKISDIIILVYSVKKRSSFERIKTFWLPEIRKEREKDEDGK